MIHEIREIVQPDIEAASKFRSRVEELSAERQELQKMIAWRESIRKTDTIFHWKEDIRDLRTRMIELDIERKAAADAEFVAEIKRDGGY
jgi:hypothetical protein